MNRSEGPGIVLSVTPLRESDLVTRIFTLSHGIVPAVARGARRSRRRLAGVVEPFALIDGSLTIPADGLSTLTEARRLDAGLLLRCSPERFVTASHFCELVLRFLPERLPNRRLFRLLWYLLDHLGSHEDLDLGSVRCFAEINLLNILGYLPRLGEAPIPETVRHKLEASLATSRISAIRFDPGETASASAYLEREILRHLGRPLESLRCIPQIRSAGDCDRNGR